jgi:rod shape-determining protein MreC
MALRSRNRSTRLLVVTLISICLVTITLDYRQGQEGPLAGLGRAALSAIAPLQDAVSGVTRPVGDFVSALVDLPSLRAENDRLRERVLQLQRDLAAVRSDEVRYQEAVALLELQESLGIDTTGAVVIGTGVDNFDWTITIDKGSDDGIVRNMPVVSSAGLVGRVVRVTAGWSQVQLIIDPGLGVGARLVVSRRPGILYGRGPADLELQSIELDTPVEVGEAVETSGFGGTFPPGIPIGTVSRIVPDPSALSRILTVRPAVDFSALEVVSVVLTSQAA